MKFLILLPILFASFVLSDEDMRLTRSSDAGKTDPLMWMIVNQLQAFQTKLTSLDAKMSKLREKDEQINEKLIKVEKMTASRKQIETFRKQFVAVETKLNAHSGKMSDLQNAVNRIKQDMKNKCSSGWKRFNNHCYMFRYDRLTWQQAKHECENYKAYLVKIETSKENRWIGNEITISASSSHDQLWTGLNDLSSEGHFTWVFDHSSVGFSNWFRGEPNNGSGVEDCGSIHTNGQSTWNDAPCAYKTGYICEK